MVTDLQSNPMYMSDTPLQLTEEDLALLPPQMADTLRKEELNEVRGSDRGS
jgi:hypothetical protein